MRYHEIINERRSNSEHPAQQKVDPYYILKKYSDRDDIYISYTKIDKLGINPGSTYQDTPNGIYCYPLKEMFPNMANSKDVPFAGTGKFIWVIQVDNKDVLELSTYTQDQFDADMAKLTAYVKQLDNPDFTINMLSNVIKVNSPLYYRNPGESLWRISRDVSVRLRKSTTYWNYLLRVVLGYNAVSDKTGLGIIYASEPTQAVILNPSITTVVDKINNKPLMWKGQQQLDNISPNDQRTLLNKLAPSVRQKIQATHPRYFDPFEDTAEELAAVLKWLATAGDNLFEYMLGLFGNIKSNKVLPHNILETIARYTPESAMYYINHMLPPNTNPSSLITIFKNIPIADLAFTMSAFPPNQSLVWDLLDAYPSLSAILLRSGTELMKAYVKNYNNAQ